MNTDILCVLCRRPMANTHRSACESCVPPDESEIVATSKLAASRREVEEAKQHLQRLFSLVAPQCNPMDTLSGVVSQIDNYLAGFIRGDKWTIEKWREEYRELMDQCEKHAIERNRLGDALQKIALLGDTGSEAHWKEFNTGLGQPIVNGWRVAERMREIALGAVGLGECETCQDEGQVQLTDDGGNRMWWPCPVCRPMELLKGQSDGK